MSTTRPDDTGPHVVSSQVKAPRTLVILRHATAQSFADDDHGRALTARGHQAATDVGRWLAQVGVVPEVALVSSALRTRETWKDLARGGGFRVTESVDEGLYSASSDTVLDSLRAAPTTTGVLLVLGHNPTVSYLVQELDDGEPDPEAFSWLSRGFPPATVAVLDVEVAWADLGPGGGRIRAAYTGRD